MIDVKELIKAGAAWFMRLRSRLLQAPSTWWFSGLTAILGGFAGMLGSVYAEQIKLAVPLIWFELGRLQWVQGPLVIAAVLFWVSLFVFGFFFGLGFRAQTQATEKLEELMRTLPPKGFLIEFEQLYKDNFGAEARAHDSEKREDLYKSIVMALSAVASLAKSFDDRNDHPCYGVNIMLFRALADIPEKQLETNIVFTEPGASRDSWDGVLQLQEEFAYTLDEAGVFKQDTTTQAIILPIPKPEFRMDGYRPTVLPGAPRIFCDPSASFAGFDNTRKLAEWCRTQSGLRASIADSIDDYFARGPGREIRSFISIPLVLPDVSNGIDQPAKDRVLGVLNLHSSREQMLPDARVALFVPLTSPFVLLMARCMAKYMSLSKA